MLVVLTCVRRANTFQSGTRRSKRAAAVRPIRFLAFLSSFLFALLSLACKQVQTRHCAVRRHVRVRHVDGQRRRHEHRRGLAAEQVCGVVGVGALRVCVCVCVCRLSVRRAQARMRRFASLRFFFFFFPSFLLSVLLSLTLSVSSLPLRWRSWRTWSPRSPISRIAGTSRRAAAALSHSCRRCVCACHSLTHSPTHSPHTHALTHSRTHFSPAGRVHDVEARGHPSRVRSLGVAVAALDYTAAVSGRVW